jgi:hypothetical protein
MAFPYVLLANFNASESQRQAMTPFLKGQIWQTCVGPRGFLKSRKTKGHFAHPVPLSQSDDKSPETKNTATQCQEIYLTHQIPKGNFPKIQSQLQNLSLLYHTNCELDKTCSPPTLRPPLHYGEGPQPWKY